MLKRLLLSLLVALVPTQGFAQATVLQGGSFTAGLPSFYSSSGGSQPIIQQSATAAGGSQSIKEMSIVARGSGTAPYTGSGGGYLGSQFCLYDGPPTGQYHQLCLGTNVTGGFGILSYNAGGGASSQDLKFNINGTSYTFPFTDGYVVGPGSSTVNDVACWNNTAGTLLKDCGAFPSVGGTNGQIQYNNAGAFGGFTVSGDGTINTSTGALAITKIGGQTVSLGGTLTTAAAFTTSGANALTLTTTTTTNVTMPASGTGTLATLAGSEALTNKTYNGNTWTAGTGTLTIAAGKTFTASNTLTLTATDGSTLAIGTGGTLGTAAYTAATAYVPSGTQAVNVLAAPVNLNNTGSYFDGPSVAQGSTGTWFASGTATLVDTAGAAEFDCKLWDGTTVVASGVSNSSAINKYVTISLSGYLATPAGNLRISCKDATSTSGVFVANGSGGAKDSIVTVFRVN